MSLSHSASRRIVRGLSVALAAAGIAGVAGIMSAAGRAEASTAQTGAARPGAADRVAAQVRYRDVVIDGVRIAYREAGPSDGPVILLLHGFPTSSHMFRNLIPALSDTYRVIAPDYPGFGDSDMPSPEKFEYSFDNLARVVDKFTAAVGAERFVMYVQDYGAPIGFRIASESPQRVRGLIIQNGNAYREGLREFWDPFRAYWKEQSAVNEAALAKFLEIDATRWQWTHGVKDVSTISPDTWKMDQLGLDRPGAKAIQMKLFMSYSTNPPKYPAWQEYFRTHQPPTLIVWGKNDFIFPAEGAEPYKRDLKNLDYHLLDTGHFALEEKGQEIAGLIRGFMRERVR